MISKGDRIKLRPNMTYKDDPSKNEIVGTGKDQFGNYQQLQTMDINNVGQGKTKTGFFYVRVYTDIPLTSDDVVTIKDILYVQRKNNVCLFGIAIEETKPFSIQNDDEEDSKYEMYGY